jgi:hypothetical protein
MKVIKLERIKWKRHVGNEKMICHLSVMKPNKKTSGCRWVNSAEIIEAEYDDVG